MVRNTEYLVIRALTREADADHTMRVDLPFAGSGYAFASDVPLLDMHAFVLADVSQSRRRDSSEGAAVWVPATLEGRERLSRWSAANPGARLGVFLRGKLIDAPTIDTRLSDGIFVRLSSPAEAEAVLNELLNGGGPK